MIAFHSRHTNLQANVGRSVTCCKIGRDESSSSTKPSLTLLDIHAKNFVAVQTGLDDQCAFSEVRPYGDLLIGKTDSRAGALILFYMEED